MAFKSIGQKLGFVSAGDVRRAREHAAEKRGEAKGREAERRKAEVEISKAHTDFLQEKLEAARELLRKGVLIDVVAKSLKLTEAQVRSL